MSSSRLPAAFFARDVLDVARDLLGCRVTHAGVTVRLTEVFRQAGTSRIVASAHAILRGEQPIPSRALTRGVPPRTPEERGISPRLDASPRLDPSDQNAVRRDPAGDLFLVERKEKEEAAAS